MRALMRLPAPHVADQVLCHFVRDTGGRDGWTTLHLPASFYGTLTLVHAGTILDGRSGRALPRIALGGPRGRPGELRFAAGTLATTVILKPGVANRLAWPGALVADEVRDGCLDTQLAALDASTSTEAHERAIAFVEDLLGQSRAQERDRFDATLRALLWRMPAMAMADLGAHFGCTPRNLQRLFLRELGVAPKLFCRLARVHGFFWQVHALGRDARPRWADLAGACGFSDQAHLHRELKALAGLTPLGFLRAIRQGPDAHWALRVPADALAWCHRPPPTSPSCLRPVA